jgi:hypothetical protein
MLFLCVGKKSFKKIIAEKIKKLTFLPVLINTYTDRLQMKKTDKKDSTSHILSAIENGRMRWRILLAIRPPSNSSMGNRLSAASPSEMLPNS